MNVKKYGIMIIASVLLVGLVFAGAAGAAEVSIENQDALFEALGGATYAEKVGTDTVKLLRDNLTFTDELIIINETGLVLDLNGYVLNMSGTHRFASITSVFTLTDSNTSNPKHYFTPDTNGLWVLNESDSSSLYNVTGGVITGGSAEKGGGVLVNSYCMFNMNDGNIVGCTATGDFDGGGCVYVSPRSIFNMAGGSISGCTATGQYGSGGGVKIYGHLGTTTFTMSNTAKIIRCLSSNNGGGVDVFSDNTANATFTMCDSAKIIGCIAINRGGGVYANTGSTSTTRAIFTMSGGEISYCSAGTGSGVEIFREDGTLKFIMNGTALVNENNDVYIWPSQSIIIGTNGFASKDYGAFNITLYDPSMQAGETIIDGHTTPGVTASTDNFKLSPSITGYKLKSGTGEQEGDLVLAELESYPIYITTATGTYQLKEAMTKVDGDDGNGFVNLTSVVGDTYTLELNGFNASNMSNVPVINASVPNLTIKLVGDSNLEGNVSEYSKGLLYSSGNLTITTDNDGKLSGNNTATLFGYAISASSDVTIVDGTITATAKGDGGSAIWAGNEVTIIDGTITATAYGTEYNYDGIYLPSAIYAETDVTIYHGTVTATANGVKGKAIRANSGNVTIENGTVNATANDEDGCAIWSSFGNITIKDGTVNATALGGWGTAIYAETDVTIYHGTTTATANSTAIVTSEQSIFIENGTVNAIILGEWGAAISAHEDVFIEDGTITVTSNGEFGISTSYGNVTINGGTITATANGEWSTTAIDAANDLIITSVDQLIANASVASFGYGNARNFAALGDDYEYWVNETGGSEPTVQLTYEQFNNTEGNWTTFESEYYLFNGSVYTNVLIKPVSAPTPEPTPKKHSESKDMGSTVILTEPVTPTPVPTATPTATAVPTIATVNPTSQQTSKSPAPVFGLIAGLGAAAVLLRLRK